MCSLLFSTKPITNLNESNRYLVKRGPDNTNVHKINECTFVHNLLSITGAFTIQPLVDEDIAVLFNGEIYNFQQFGNYDNDTKCIIPLYKKYGEEFIKYLDGEYAIVLIDFKNNKIIFTSDVFGTKPLFYAIEDGNVGVSTYRSGLADYKNVKKHIANTTLICDLKGNIIKQQSVYDFDLKQYKTNIDGWIKAFEKSIKKRAYVNVREKLFIGLSSGYDSGAIACELSKQNIPFKYYTVVGSENKKVLEERWRLLSKQNISSEITIINPPDRQKAHNYLLQNTEDWKYTIHSKRSDYNEFNLSLWDDNGSNHLSHLCSLAKQDGRKILLSGAGADELHDYGWNGNSKYAHSNFGGLFPENLKEIFPWPSFFSSSMESYLMKDEVVGGSYGMEVRYPFLDTLLVQEYLWLSHNLKNMSYKHEIGEYLKINGFPYSPNEKIGF
jgi:asparagine synthetase B (glutamine-hydrolysing)